jgi:hypothetical protein
METNIFENVYKRKKNPFTTTKTFSIFNNNDFNNYFDNKKRPIPLRTMIPMCLWVNKTKKLSRIDYPYLDRKTGKISCKSTNSQISKHSELPTWLQNMKQHEQKEWKQYNYWVFNVFNLPPKPNGMNIFQVTNKSEYPWNLVGLGDAGVLGNPNSIIYNADNWESGLFTFLDQNDDTQWRFMTYTQPVPNTKILYIYDTNMWNVNIPKNKIPDAKNILNSKISRFGAASPVGVNSPSQLYITPEPDNELNLSFTGSAYLWVCEREYTQFICPESIIIPYSEDLFTIYGFSKTKPLGYLTALAKSTRNMQDWIKYKSGSSNKIRSKLSTLNYNKTVKPIENTLTIVLSLVIFSCIVVVLFYLFKK